MIQTRKSEFPYKAVKNNSEHLFCMSMSLSIFGNINRVINPMNISPKNSILAVD